MAGGRAGKAELLRVPGPDGPPRVETDAVVPKDPARRLSSAGQKRRPDRRARLGTEPVDAVRRARRVPRIDGPMPLGGHKTASPGTCARQPLPACR
jgi:hypothetical protein